MHLEGSGAMHIPDGFIDIPTSLAFAGLSAAGVALSLKGAKSSLDEKTALSQSS